MEHHIYLIPSNPEGHYKGMCVVTSDSYEEINKTMHKLKMARVNYENEKYGVNNNLYYGIFYWNINNIKGEIDRNAT